MAHAQKKGGKTEMECLSEGARNEASSFEHENRANPKREDVTTGCAIFFQLLLHSMELGKASAEFVIKRVR